MTTLSVGPVRLRSRNRLTLPNDIVKAAGIGVGDRLVVGLDPTDPDVVTLRRVRTSYAGALRGMYVHPGEYLEEERAGWG